MDPDADAGDSGQRGRQHVVCEAFHHAVMPWIDVIPLWIQTGMAQELVHCSQNQQNLAHNYPLGRVQNLHGHHSVAAIYPVLISPANEKPYLNSTKADPVQQEKNPEALKEGLALLQNAQNLIGQQCSQCAFVEKCWEYPWNNPFDLMVERIIVLGHFLCFENHHFHWSRPLSPNPCCLKLASTILYHHLYHHISWDQ